MPGSIINMVFLFHLLWLATQTKQLFVDLFCRHKKVIYSLNRWWIPWQLLVRFNDLFVILYFILFYCYSATPHKVILPI